jgi:type VI secretion system protein ImpG
MQPTHAEIYQVTEVVGIRQGQSERRSYKPFVGFEHAADPKEGSYFTLRPTVSPLDDGMDTYLSIVTPLGDSPVRDEEVLSFELTCSNRSLPAELQLGEINVAPRGSSSPAKFKNISPVTVSARPRLGSELLWRLLSHMSIARSSLADAEVLRSLLSLYNFQRDVSPTLGRANDLKIEAIRAVHSDVTTRLMGGAPVRGVQVRIELEESKFGSIGEAFLFGCVLDEVFATHVPLNSFNELVLNLHPSKAEFRWPARSGQRRIL